MNVQVGDSRLRHWLQPQLLRFAAKIARHQSLNHFALDVFGKTLADDRRWHMATPETGQARKFLIFLDQRFGLTGHFLGGNLDLNFPFDTVSGFGGAHVSSSVICTRLCRVVESQSIAWPFLLSSTGPQTME